MKRSDLYAGKYFIKHNTRFYRKPFILYCYAFCGSVFRKNSRKTGKDCKENVNEYMGKSHNGQV